MGWSLRVVGVAFVCLVVACGDDDPRPSGACTDGVLNGDETAVDCGGSCGATCGLGEACSRDEDCLFGACGAMATCEAPTEGPAPTGPVTATIGPAGGSVSLVTDERVAVTATFPAGALDAPRVITLTPRTPARSWVEIAIDPVGVVLAQPLALVAELPPASRARRRACSRSAPRISTPSCRRRSRGRR